VQSEPASQQSLATLQYSFSLLQTMFTDDDRDSEQMPEWHTCVFALITSPRWHPEATQSRKGACGPQPCHEPGVFIILYSTVLPEGRLAGGQFAEQEIVSPAFAGEGANVGAGTASGWHVDTVDETTVHVEPGQHAFGIGLQFSELPEGMQARQRFCGGAAPSIQQVIPSLGGAYWQQGGPVSVQGSFAEVHVGAGVQVQPRIRHEAGSLS
jgi:hypothetical protein